MSYSNFGLGILREKMILVESPIYGHSSNYLPNGDLYVYLDRRRIIYKLQVSIIENILISEVNFMLWRNRCENVFQRKLNGPSCVIAKLKYKLNLMSKIAKKKLSISRYFALWGNLNNIINVL